MNYNRIQLFNKELEDLKIEMAEIKNVIAFAGIYDKVKIKQGFINLQN